MPIKVNQADIPRKISERLDFEGGATISHASDLIAPCVIVNPNDQPVPTLSREEASLLRGRMRIGAFTGKVVAAPGTVFVTQSGGKSVRYTRMWLTTTVTARIDVYLQPTANTPGSTTSFTGKNKAYSAPAVKSHDITLGSPAIRKTITVTDNGTLAWTGQIPAATVTEIPLGYLFPIDESVSAYHLNIVTSAAGTVDGTVEFEEGVTREDYSEL